MDNKLYWIKLLNHLEGKGFDSTKDWIDLLDGLNLLDKGYKFEIIVGKFGWKHCNIKKIAANGDFILLESQCNIQISTNRSSIKFNGKKIFDAMQEMANAVHEKCNELFKELAKFEAEAEKEKQAFELAKRKFKTESDAKLKEMELIFQGMKISNWSYSEGIAHFRINDIVVKTYDMLTFRTTQTPYVDKNATKLLVDVYNKVT